MRQGGRRTRINRRGFAVQCVPGSVRDSDVQQLADMTRGSFKHDDFIPAGSAHEPGRIGFAGAFTKDLDLAADKPGIPPARPVVHQREELLVPFLLEPIRHLIEHARRRGVLTF